MVLHMDCLCDAWSMIAPPTDMTLPSHTMAPSSQELQVSFGSFYGLCWPPTLLTPTRGSHKRRESTLNPL